MLKEGDLLRYERITAVDLAEPVWVRVQRGSQGEVVVQGSWHAPPGHTFAVISNHDNLCDNYTVRTKVEGEPDEFLAACARQALLGETNE